ncbi:MAG: hypothetical protein LAO04_19415 [Acidobacteriia bacterium]|nr:hypothetical protein [Terriglobia bacterium]
MENYFNYFTEIEEQFRKCRAEPTLLSPLDWALVESWKEQGFPLEAVRAGIERSFAKFQTRKRGYRKVNTLAYCAQEVFRAVEEARAAATQGGTRPPATQQAAPFSAEEIARFLARCARAVESAGRQAREAGQQVLAEDLTAAAATLQAFSAREQAQPSGDLEGMERDLTALEEKLTASLLRATAVELLAQLRAEVERGLVPYRRKMAAAEVESLERRFLKNRLLEHYKIPRLSLFYL